MSYEQLVIWLHGMLELRDVSKISHEEAKVMLQGIKDHVALNFLKVTPKLGADETIAKPKDKPIGGKSLAELMKEYTVDRKIDPKVWPQSPFTPLPYYPPQPQPNWLYPAPSGPGVITC